MATHAANTLPTVPQPVKSTASVVAIVCAVGSFFVDHAALKLLLVVIAVIAGLVGMLKAVHPRISGGILSIVAILIACVGFIVALLDVVF